MKLDNLIYSDGRKSIYQEDGKKIKVFDGSYAKSDVLNEALNHARIEEAGLRVPKLLEVANIDGKWAIVMEYVAGKTLAELMQENPEKTDAYLERLVDTQLEIQSHSCRLLTRHKDKMRRKIAETNFDAELRYDLNVRLDGMPSHREVLHGDFNPSNVIISDKDGEAYIIDWAHVTQGDGAADAARTYLLFWLAGDIQNAEKYLDIFCRKSDMPRENVQKWLPIVAASQTVKGKPEEREFLLGWVNVTDYM